MPYQVYLAIAPRSGQARAHVPDLPGCSLRGRSREEVLAHLPGAITAYLAWLKQHGEPAPAGEDTSFDIVEQTAGAVALHPGDRAALLASDLVPLTETDIERYLRLMRFSRQDLLALVVGLSDSVLDWQPPHGGWTIRTVLRHLSGAERWYLDRLGLYSRLKRTRTIFDNLESSGWP